jgi:RNA recognition motif-containing protein
MTKQAGRDKKEQLANKGFAYVDFNDVGPKVAAIALSETELGFRKLLIKDATSFEGRPKKENADATAKKQDGKSEQPASRKIFVGNLGFKTTEDDLRSHFEKCGEIDWVKIATFEDTGKCKGFGWIKFREPEAAAQAVKGFVKVKEQVETEADFVNPSKNEGEEEEKEEEGSDQDSDAEKPTKRFRTRKWWLNRLMGRPLKLELAEDDQVRYKKRFGKDAPKKAQGDGLKAQRKPGEDAEGKENAGARERSDPAPLKAQDDLMVARLTGAAAKHTGTKITFD